LSLGVKVDEKKKSDEEEKKTNVNFIFTFERSLVWPLELRPRMDKVNIDWAVFSPLLRTS
jgi:hypothetical protein